MKNNLPFKILTHFIALIWCSLIVLPITLILELVAAEHTLRGFIAVWLFFTMAFWLLDIFSFYILRMKDETAVYTFYQDDYPELKKIIHYSGFGKYEKHYH